MLKQLYHSTAEVTLFLNHNNDRFYTIVSGTLIALHKAPKSNLLKSEHKKGSFEQEQKNEMLCHNSVNLQLFNARSEIGRLTEI